jgi:catechol 2,3-dioxygenase-like lactoylglutathione lyase family enzyme
MTEAMLSHLGICVTDVDRSRRFYCELFGFQETYSRVVHDDRFARLMQSPSQGGGSRTQVGGAPKSSPADLSTFGSAKGQPVAPGTT